MDAFVQLGYGHFLQITFRYVRTRVAAYNVFCRGDAPELTAIVDVRYRERRAIFSTTSRAKPVCTTMKRHRLGGSAFNLVAGPHSDLKCTGGLVHYELGAVFICALFVAVSETQIDTRREASSLTPPPPHPPGLLWDWPPLSRSRLILHEHAVDLRSF